MLIQKVTCDECGHRNWIPNDTLEQGTVKEFYLSELLALYNSAKENCELSLARDLLIELRELNK
jgi:hypothetical protein